MPGLIVFVLALGVLYFSWRAIRGGFERPQSERLNGFGYVGRLVMFLVALSFVLHFAE